MARTRKRACRVTVKRVHSLRRYGGKPSYRWVVWRGREWVHTGGGQRTKAAALKAARAAMRKTCR